MISFVWPASMPFIPWAGGVEVYTTAHINELRRRGIDARIVGCSTLTNDSLKKYPEIPSLLLDNEQQLAQLDETLAFVMQPARVTTKRQAYVILHTPIKGPLRDRTPAFANNGMGDKLPITTSMYMAEYWKDILDLLVLPAVVYPAVDGLFSEVVRPVSKKPMRILYAGRSTPEKGVYTLLASLHMLPLRDKEFSLTCVETMNNSGGAEVIHALFRAHPFIKTIPHQPDRESMAKMFSKFDIVVMPSTTKLWKEAFGMISIEAQSAGCRVVASNGGGLPETDCGGLLLVEPDNPLALAERMAKAIELGPLSKIERHNAGKKFTIEHSVDALIRAIPALRS